MVVLPAPQTEHFQAARCLYMALSFAASEQHVQAYSLLQRTVERVDSATTKHQARAKFILG